MIFTICAVFNDVSESNKSSYAKMRCFTALNCLSTTLTSSWISAKVWDMLISPITILFYSYYEFFLLNLSSISSLFTKEPAFSRQSYWSVHISLKFWCWTAIEFVDKCFAYFIFMINLAKILVFINDSKIFLGISWIHPLMCWKWLEFVLKYCQFGVEMILFLLTFDFKIHDSLKTAEFLQFEADMSLTDVDLLWDCYNSVKFHNFKISTYLWQHQQKKAFESIHIFEDLQGNNEFGSE